MILAPPNFAIAKGTNKNSVHLQRLSYWFEQGGSGEITTMIEDSICYYIPDHVSSSRELKDVLSLVFEYILKYPEYLDNFSIAYDITILSSLNVKSGDIENGRLIVNFIKNFDKVLTKTDSVPICSSTFLTHRGIDLRIIYGLDVVPVLFDLISNTDLPEEVKADYCELIAEFHNKDDFEMLLSVSKKFADKSRMISVLCRTGDERALDYVIPHLETNERDIAYGLMYVPSRRSIELLIKILEHQIEIGAECTGSLYGTAYDCAILSLGVIGDESAIPVLKKALSDSNEIEARRLAAWSLWMLEDKSGIPVMVEDGQWRDLEIMADPYVVSFIIPRLETSDEETQISIIKLLVEIGNTEATQALMNCYQRTDLSEDIKDYIALSLVQQGEKSLLPRVYEILSDTLRKRSWNWALYELLSVDNDQRIKSILQKLIDYEEYRELAIMNLIFLGENIDIIKTLGYSTTEIVLKYQKFLKKLRRYLSPSVMEYIELLIRNQSDDYEVKNILNALPKIFSQSDIPELEQAFVRNDYSYTIKAQFYLKLALLSQTTKDYEKEEIYAALALENAYKTKIPYHILHSQWMLADAYMYTGKYDKAEKLLEEATELCSHLSNDERQDFELKFPDAYSYYLLGELDLKRKNYKQALRSFTTARNELNYRLSTRLIEFMAQREPRDRLKAMIASGLGVCHTELGKGAFEEAVEGFEKVGVTNIREQESRDRAYYGLIRSAVAEGNYEEAQRLTEKLILIKMNEDFERMEISPVNPERKKEMEELKKRKKEIEEMKRELEKEEEQGAVADTIIQRKTREFKKYIHKLKTENPKLFTIVNAEPSNLKELQDMGIIPENMAILQYLLGEEEMYIFIVKTYDLFIKKVSVKQAKIAGLIDEYRTLIKNRAPMDEIDEYATELYKYLIEPVEPEISGVEILGIIPNQQLYYLPFSALKKVKEKNFLGERYRIFYINSTSLLGIVAQNQGCDISTAPFIAFANADGTLPEAEVEVKNISNLYPEVLTLYQDKAVKDTVFKTTGCQIIHFATHGVAVPYDPTSSYLVLAPQGEKGQLKVEEIWGLDLKDCPLVVLSACETAEGRLIAGDEVVSLAFGFIYAGSASCLATLWEVASQSTADLMQEFHKNLKDGKSRIQALQDAQVFLLKNPKTSHPFFWTPFILIGDWR
ncbi:MAG: CHAT domain-containing protein [candidate division WOR-3 bacterium]